MLERCAFVKIGITEVIIATSGKMFLERYFSKFYVKRVSMFANIFVSFESNL